MLRCGAWPNLGYRLDKPWVRPYTANYKSDSRVIFVISISLTRFHSTEFGTVSCQAHCRSSTSSSTLSRTRFAPGPPIKLEVNALKFWQLTCVHCVASDSCHSGFCACSFQPFCENLIFMRSNLISYYLPCLTLCPFFVIQNLNWAMTSVLACHWSNQWYALACAYFLRCVDSIARSRSAVVWDSPSGPGTGCELERSHNAPESECRRRDSRRQEKVTAFIGLQMRVLWWWVWVSDWHGLPSPTPQFHRYTLCRSHELQVHVIDPTRRFVHGKSSTAWHSRCVHIRLAPCADFVLTFCHTHFVIPN